MKKLSPEKRERMRRQVHVRLDKTVELAYATLDRAIQKLQEAQASLPPEHQASARLTREYHCDPGELAIEYERPETDEELDARIEMMQRSAERQEEREKEEYERLQKKYGGKKKNPAPARGDQERGR